MLNSIIIGTAIGPQVNNKWEVVADKFNADRSILVNESINQRIKLGARVKDTLEEVYSGTKASGYNIDDHIIISNNFNNMNINIMKSKSRNKKSIENVDEGKAVTDVAIDESLLFVTLSNDDYTLIHYDTLDNEIKATYQNRKKGYQGCVLTYRETNEEKVILLLYVEDNITHIIKAIAVKIDKNGHVSYIIEDATRDDLRHLREVNKYLKFTHFKVYIPSKQILTKWVLCGEEHEDEVKKYLEKNYPKCEMYVIPNTYFGKEADKNVQEKVNADLMEKLTNNRVRAVTISGIKVPKNFCMTYKILYMFDFDVENLRTSCIRSN